MSKFLFHIRVSDQGSAVNEHEMFEMMRSRNLYQIQFDLKRRLQKRIRSIELDQKVQASTFEMKKVFFLNKMQEKVKLRNSMMEKNAKRNSIDNNSNPQQSVFKRTNTSLQFQNTFLPHGKSGTFIHNEEQSGHKRQSVTQPSPSYSTRKDSDEDHFPSIVRATTVMPYAGTKMTEDFDKIPKQRRLKSEGYGGPRSMYRNNSIMIAEKDENIEQIDIAEYGGGFSNVEDDLDPLLNRQTSEYLPRLGNQSEMRENENKFKSDKTNSKRVSYNMRRNSVNSQESDTRRGSYKDHNQNNDDYLHYLGQSEFREKRSLASYEMGATTPSGKLLLFREDHEKYLDKFKQQQQKRLLKSRRHSENLEEKIRFFQSSRNNTNMFKEIDGIEETENV